MSRILSLEHQPEPFAATGNISAPGVENQLGRPEMDPFAVLVREAVQNSWDAKLEGSSSIDFRINLVTLSADQQQFLRNTIFSELPPKIELAGELKREPLRLLILSDRGTQGLGGPTRADEVAGDQSLDFVDFFRNVGQPPDTEYGGGTYGYGKAAFYRVSGARTICAHTQCVQPHSEPESRFMAAGLGEPYGRTIDGKERKFTGRHWWGRRRSGVVEPLIGDEADEAARRLGFPGYAPGNTGTSVAVVAPRLRHREPREALRFMADCILWYYWPKMLRETTCRIRFGLYYGEHEVSVPDPREYPPLDGFVNAMSDLKRHESGEDYRSVAGYLKEARCLRPKKPLGMISLRKFPRQRRQFLCSKADQEHLPFGARASSHIALLRHPEFVVRYVEGPQLEDDVIEYGGVFRAYKDMDRTYAYSEPPAHDDWVPDNMEGHEATYIRTTFTRINEALKDFAQPIEARETDRASLQLPLGGFSSSLAGLIPGASEGGGIVPKPGNGKSSEEENGDKGGVEPPPLPKKLGRSSVLAEDAELRRTEENLRIAVIPFSVDHASEADGSRVTASMGVAIEEGAGRERTPPQGEKEPQIHQWISPDGQTFQDQSVAIAADDGNTWRLEIELPEEAVSKISLSAEPFKD